MNENELLDLIAVLTEGSSGEKEPVATEENYSMTMVAEDVLLQLADAVYEILDLDIPGDFIECGVWRGGCCILMKKILDSYPDLNRKIWVADSFQGLPKPDPGRYPLDRGSWHWKLKHLVASAETVKANFEKLGCLDNRIVFLEGFFRDTMGLVPDDQGFSILRLDGDIYESTILCMKALFPKLSSGGILIVDDYKKHRVRAAIDDYYKSNSMKYRPHFVGFQCAWWRK